MYSVGKRDPLSLLAGGLMANWPVEVVEALEHWGWQRHEVLTSEVANRVLKGLGSQVRAEPMTLVNPAFDEIVKLWPEYKAFNGVLYRAGGHDTQPDYRA